MTTTTAPKTQADYEAAYYAARVEVRTVEGMKAVGEAERKASRIESAAYRKGFQIDMLGIDEQARKDIIAGR